MHNARARFPSIAFAAATLLAAHMVTHGVPAGAASVAEEQAINQLRSNVPAKSPGQSATLLPNGRWLLLGGESSDHRPTRTGALVVGRAADIIVATVEMTVARSGHTATVLPDGAVLIIGGVGEDGRVVAEAEIFNVESATFARTPKLVLLPRAFHTTTLLTDGRLLIAGGVGANGAVLDDAEIVNAFDDRVERFNARLERARFNHLAVLLPSAPVLVTGGLGVDDQTVQSSELFDPEARRFSLLDDRTSLSLPQVGEQAASPFIAAVNPPQGATGVPVDQTISVRFSKLLRVETLDERSVTLFGPTGVVAINVVPAEAGLLLFATPKEELLPSSSYTLFIHGAVDTVGMSLPFTAVGFHTAAIGATMAIAPPRVGSDVGSRPSSPALPIQPAAPPPEQGTGSASSELATPTTQPAIATPDSSTGGRSTLAAIAESDEEWTPSAADYQSGMWTTNRLVPASARDMHAKGRLHTAASTGSALTGLVLRLNEKPLPGVTLRIGSRSTQTNGDGTFLIENVPPGSQTLVIDATAAGPEYGFFETLVEITEGGTSVLPYTIWIPKLDRQNVVRIPSPTLSEVVLTSPKMPGFAVVIPPGVVIRDRAGKIVTELGITPIPIDRTPFPLPAIFEFNTFYTIQPAGAMLQSLDGKPVRARVIYPNYANASPGTRMLFWNHDPIARGWHIYGEGEVSADGNNIIPDANVGIYQFSGFMVSTPGTLPPSQCPCGAPDGGGGPTGSGNPASPGVPFDGDPVNLATSQFIYSHTDLFVNDIVPLKLQRLYIENDAAGITRPFGLNMLTGMDYQLYNPAPTGPTGTVFRLYLTTPDGARIDLLCVLNCTQTAVATFEGQTPGYFYKSVMINDLNSTYGAEWKLTTKDGTSYIFYNNGGRIKYIRDRYGNTTTFTRTPFLIGNLTAVVSPNGKSIEFIYSGNRIAETRDNSGRKWTYAYNGGRMISATDPMGGIWNYTWDNYAGTPAVMLSVKDPRGNTVVTNAYTQYLGLTKQTYADGSTTSFAWTRNPQNNAAVSRVDVTDRRGNVRRMAFSPDYYVSSDTFALGKPESQTTTFTRDPTTNLILSKTDPLGRVTSYTYDAKGNVLTYTRLAGTPNAVTWIYTYEPTFNQLATATDPLGHMTSFVHDGLGSLTRVVDANNNSMAMTYTSQGQVATIADALTHTSVFGYSAGILTSVIDSLGRTTSTAADDVGRIVSAQDPQGSTVQTAYDSLDRVNTVTDPLGNAMQFAYDANGNLLSHTDARGNRATYTYDPSNRVSTKKDALLNVETYTYDSASMPKQVTDRKGQVSGMTYDAMNRRVSIGFGATTGSPSSFDSTIGYSFDTGNRLVQATDSRNGNVLRNYDGLNRLVQEQTQQGIVSYTYDNAGRRTSMTVQGQPAVIYTYDNGNRLLQVQQSGQNVSFTYDTANRRTQTTLPNGVTINYAYDNANQLAAITYVKGTTTLGDLTYSYNAAGRRIGIGGSFARTNLPTTIASASYNANNQLMQWYTQTLSYDLNGNLTSDGTYTYLWNSRNQLTQVRQGVTVVGDYQYDSLGRRRQKTVNNIATQFLYDGQNLVQELNGVGSVTANLLIGLQLDELYARSQSGSTNSFLTDHLGSIVAEADASATINTTYSYDPYGQTTQSGTASSNSQRYTGREQDTADLYYYRARYYSPSIDRFVTEDPIGIEGGPNVYLYVNNDPVSSVDPLGLQVARAPRWRAPKKPRHPQDPYQDLPDPEEPPSDDCTFGCQPTMVPVPNNNSICWKVCDTPYACIKPPGLPLGDGCYSKCLAPPFATRSPSR